MDYNIQSLIEVSRYYGNNPDYIIAGGGNTSFKDEKHIWVKASGTSMAEIDKDGFVCLNREKMQCISTKEYSSNSSEREQAVKEDLANAIVSPADKRPSVETSMHEIIQYPFVVHTHPNLVNGLLCARNSKEITNKLFGSEAIYIEYTDPGYVLFKKVDAALKAYRKKYNKETQLIFLENHGIFVGANTIDEIKTIYNKVECILESNTSTLPDSGNGVGSQTLDIFGEQINLHFNKLYHLIDTSDISRYYSNSLETFSNVRRPFTPDIIVYCKSKYLFLNSINNGVEDIKNFEEKHGHKPKVIVVAGKGIVVLEENKNSAQIVMDVFKDMLKIACYTQSFGGPRPMTAEQIDFIDNWEVENYRRKVSKETR